VLQKLALSGCSWPGHYKIYMELREMIDEPINKKTTLVIIEKQRKILKEDSKNIDKEDETRKSKLTYEHLIQTAGSNKELRTAQSKLDDLMEASKIESLDPDEFAAKVREAVCQNIAATYGGEALEGQPPNPNLDPDGNYDLLVEADGVTAMSNITIKKRDARNEKRALNFLRWLPNKKL
jgi:hypothetical protein